MPSAVPEVVLGAIREVQIPLLTVMLLGGCGAKGLRVMKTRDMAVGLGGDLDRGCFNATIMIGG